MPPRFGSLRCRRSFSVFRNVSRLPRGCLALIGAVLVLVTVAFGTGALYLELHGANGHIRALRPGRMLLLALILAIPLAGAGYLMYLEFGPTSTSRRKSSDR